MIENTIFIIASFFAGIFATVAGFGSSTLLLPVATFFIDVKTAIFLVASFHLFSNLFKVKTFWGKIDFRIFWLFGIPSIIFAFLGALLISILPVEIIQKILAAFLVLFSIYTFLKPELGINKTKINAVIGGSLSGLLAGLIGLGGAVRSAFLISFNLAKEVYVGTSAMIAFVVDITRIPTYLFIGVVKGTNYYMLIPLLFVSAYLGVNVGKMLLSRINQVAFRRFVSIVILVMGIKLFFT